MMNQANFVLAFSHNLAWHAMDKDQNAIGICLRFLYIELTWRYKTAGESFSLVVQILGGRVTSSSELEVYIFLT